MARRTNTYPTIGRPLRKRSSDGDSIFKNVDWFTVILYLLLVIAGVFSIYAASYDYDHASIFSFEEFSGKQIRWIGLSLLLGLVLLIVDARMYETYAYPIYLALGSMSLQPAEFAKFATALALAKLFSGYNFNLNA